MVVEVGADVHARALDWRGSKKGSVVSQLCIGKELLIFKFLNSKKKSLSPVVRASGGGGGGGGGGGDGDCDDGGPSFFFEHTG